MLIGRLGHGLDMVDVGQDQRLFYLRSLRNFTMTFVNFTLDMGVCGVLLFGKCRSRSQDLCWSDDEDTDSLW